MRSRLRLFVLVGLVATGVDVGVFAAARGWNLLVADVVALGLAAIVAYLLNRMLTFRGSPDARWVRRPSWFAATAVAAGIVDLLVLSALVALGVIPVGAKVVAVFSAAVLRWVAYRRILFREVRRELAEQLDRPPAAGTARLSIVVPAYREEDLIGETIEVISDELRGRRPEGRLRDRGGGRWLTRRHLGPSGGGRGPGGHPRREPGQGGGGTGWGGGRSGAHHRVHRRRPGLRPRADPRRAGPGRAGVGTWWWAAVATTTPTPWCGPGG